MQSKRELVIGIAAVVVVVLAIAAYVFFARGAGTPGTATTGTSTPITTTVGGVTMQGSGTVTESTSSVSAPPAPNYKNPLSFDASVSADVRTLLTSKYNTAVAAIEKNPTDFAGWVNLGILRKTAGDYVGAAADWQYVAALYPSSTVPFDNLGELYLDFIKDYPKAETNFKQAIKINPHDINAYQQLFSLYTTYGYKANTSAAADIVAQGLKDNPNNATLLQFQSQLNSK